MEKNKIQVKLKVVYQDISTVPNVKKNTSIREYSYAEGRPSQDLIFLDGRLNYNKKVLVGLSVDLRKGKVRS